MATWCVGWRPFAALPDDREYELVLTGPARRGTYRILYRINEEEPREVIVVRIEHRRDAYRPR